MRNVVEASRYSRQELFAGIGPAGQARIRASSAVIVGCGALGSLAAETLTRAGIGELVVIDRDYVEPSNLQRQVLFTEADAAAGTPKAVAAERRLRAINADVNVRGVVADLSSRNAAELIGKPTLVLDGTDNFETRFLVNDVCVRAAIPWVYGACVGSYGLVLTVRPHRTPCLRCVLEELPAPGSSATCDTAGVIAPVVQVIAGIQGAEALKLLTGAEERLLPGFAMVDVWSGDFDVVSLRGRAPTCPACTASRFEYAEAPTVPAAVLCGRGAVQVRPLTPLPVDLNALGQRLRSVGDVVANDHLVRATVDGIEIAVFKDGRAIIKGVADEAQARAVYARYVGN